MKFTTASTTPGTALGSQTVTQFVRAVLEPEREADQEHTDLTGELDEVGTHVDGAMPPLPTTSPARR